MIDAETAALITLEDFVNFFYYGAIGLCGLLFFVLIAGAIIWSKK